MRSVPLRRILLPHDFSKSSGRALQVALGLALALRAELRAVHVVSQRAVLRRLTRGTTPLALESPESAYWLDELWRVLGSASEQVTSSVALLEGDVVEQLVQEACAWRADLVVMGRRGTSARGGWGVGSVTEQMLLRAPAPVLSVPWPAAVPAGFSLQRLLVPVEFGEQSLRPLDYATALARASGCQLLLLHVLDYFAGETPGGEEQWGVPELHVDMADVARERLRRVLPSAALSLGGRQELVVPGRPQREIVRVATERDVDLVVLGFDARRVIGRCLPGSTLSHVVRGAACPVLAVPQS